MASYQIADLKVDVSGQNTILERQGSAYQAKWCGQPDIRIVVGESVSEKARLYPTMTPDEQGYFLSGGQFYTQLPDFDGFVLHASAVEVDGSAYLFSAGSGTGKSTHTMLWQSCLGSDRVRVINDDKPAIRLINGIFYCYGTPWSGKSGLSRNVRVPLGGIVFLVQSPQNHIAGLNGTKALKLLLQNTIRPRDINRLETLLMLFNGLMVSIPVYELHCTQEPHAALLCCQTILHAKQKGMLR